MNGRDFGLYEFTFVGAEAFSELTPECSHLELIARRFDAVLEGFQSAHGIAGRGARRPQAL